MNYEILKPPFSLAFTTMQRKELEAYQKWFFEIMPERISQLERVVRSASVYREWSADFSPDSLEVLGEWFSSQVEVRPRTDEELTQIRTGSPLLSLGSDYELTNRTFSMAVDSGMYFGQVFIENSSKISWGQCLTSKKDADYGQPVLFGFHQVQLNPVRILVTLAYGIARQRRSGKRLHELYFEWMRMLPN